MDLNQYLDMFIEEAKEHLQAINENLLELEKNPSNIEVVNEVFRSAHTLKGMSATMGFDDLASLTHEMENVLDLVRNNRLTLNSNMMDIIFRCVDLLESMVLSIVEGGDGKLDVSKAVSELQAVLSGKLDAKAEVAVGATLEESQQTIDNTVPINLDQYETTIVKQSLESGNHVYLINTVIGEECVLKSARAYMVFDRLESMGEIVKAVPSVQDIEEERFDQTFQVLLITPNLAEEIEKAVLGVSEVDSVEIVPFSEEWLEKKTEKKGSTDLGSVRKEEAENQQSKTSEPVQNGKKVQTGKTIRVDIERLDSLMNLFSELVIDRGRLEQLARESEKPELIETVEHMSRISGDLQSMILTMRMVPVEQVFNRFPRMVRDLAKDLNKKVRLEISGAETELDRTVIDEIGDPLVHILRNAIDHGLEPANERAALGKDEEGTVQLKAFHSGNHVFIEISDDGKGIDRSKILNKALEKGVVSSHIAESLTDNQVYDLLFSSGFSTAEKISDISGRGVGLDVVKTKIESLGGSISITSKVGEGSTFLIQLPLTLSIISAMLVQVENEKYAVPLSSIIETAVYKRNEIMHAHFQDVIDFRGKVVPLVYLKNIFKIPQSENKKRDDEVAVVIVRKGDKMAALVVDSFIGQQEIVLKSLGKYLINVFAISGATILGDGQVALILDCNALIK